MTGETVLVPGARDVRGTLDTAADDGDDASRADAAVVACPPHPKLGGSRRDQRLRAVSDALTGRGFDCLRIDYGPWDEGRGEQVDAGNAVEYFRERYDRVGLFGYSFGASISLLVAAERSDLAAVSVLAPAARLHGHDAAASVERVAAPLQVVYGSRDDVADWEPVVDAARAAEADVVEIGGDHHFVGQGEKIGGYVADFFEKYLR